PKGFTEHCLPKLQSRHDRHHAHSFLLQGTTVEDSSSVPVPCYPCRDKETVSLYCDSHRKGRTSEKRGGRTKKATGVFSCPSLLGPRGRSRCEICALHGLPHC